MKLERWAFGVCPLPSSCNEVTTDGRKNPCRVLSVKNVGKPFAEILSKKHRCVCMYMIVLVDSILDVVICIKSPARCHSLRYF